MGQIGCGGASGFFEHGGGFCQQVFVPQAGDKPTLDFSARRKQMDGRLL